MHPLVRTYSGEILAIIRRELPGPVGGSIALAALLLRVSRLYGTWKRLSGDPYARIVKRR